MKIAVVTANMGSFDKPVEYVKQSVDYDFYEFTDENFPPRICSMTPRLQARIPKMFSWQMCPGYDYYIWVDRSSSLQHVDSVKWFIEQCKDVDIAVFQHPMRNTIQEEAAYIAKRLSRNCEYIVPRYKNELIDEQLAVIQGDKDFVDDHLFASTAFIYHNSTKTQDMMVQWWYHTSRFHSVDQLSLPYVIWKSGCSFNMMKIKQGRNLIRTPYLSLVRYL